MLVVIDDDPQPYVAPAAKGLDQLWPGWEHMVDPESLDMFSCIDCVLGQIWHSVYAHKSTDYEWIQAFGEACGFLIDNKLWPGIVEGVFSDNIVRELWIDEILARRTEWQKDLDESSRTTLAHV